MGKTVRRIFPTGLRPNTVAGQSHNTESVTLDVKRLSEVAKKQQEIIIEYASHEYRAEQSIPRVEVDETTDSWLKSCFGNVGKFSEGVEIFNSKENLETLLGKAKETSLLNWEFDPLELDVNTLIETVCDIFRLFGFEKHEDNLKTYLSSISEQSVLCVLVQSLQTLSLTCIHVLPFEEGSLFPKLTKMDVLAMFMSVLIPSREDVDFAETLAEFFSRNTAILDSIGDTNTIPFRKVMNLCFSAQNSELHWLVVQNLDLLLGIITKNSNNVTETSVSGKYNEMLRVFLMQGMVRAASQSMVCKPIEIANKWIARVAEAHVAGKESPRNVYRKSLITESETTKSLIALNYCDFIAAPLWVALVHHTPGFQLPTAVLTLNRGTWSSSILDQTTVVDRGLETSLRIRKAAYLQTFASIQFEPNSECTRKRKKRREDEIVLYKDFVALEDDTMRSTGASVYFLSLLGNIKGRRENVRQSLAKSIGLLEDADSINLPVQLSSSNSAAAVIPRVGTTSSTSAKVAPLDSVISKAAIEPKKKGTSGKRNNINVFVANSVTKDADKDDKETKKLSPNEEKIHRVLEYLLYHPATYPVLSFLTVFALFGDDLKLALFSKTADYAFGIITLITLLLFVIEITAKIIVVPNYRNGFFFWLDVIATVSLVPDVPFVWDALLAGVNSAFTEENDFSLTRASRASRAGARAARVIRILRLVRLLRILKLYEFIQMRRHGKAQNESKAHTQMMLRSQSSRYVSRYLIKKRMSSYRPGKMTIKDLNSQKGSEQQKQSKVGAKLADLTTRRVIMVVLIILFMLPIMNLEETDYSLDVGVGMVHAASIQYLRGLVNLTSFNETVNSFILGTPKLIVLRSDVISHTQPLFGQVVDEAPYRTAEIRTAVQFCHSYSGELKPEQMAVYTFCTTDTNVESGLWNFTTYASIDNTSFEIESAWRNVGQTIFIIFVFGLATMIFTYDAHKLVIAPIEKMVRIVEELAQNPLTTFENDDSDDEMNELLKSGKKRYNEKNGGDQGAFETKLLENCIKKIGGLLQVGFGEAGAEIIASNMNGTGELDPMIPGRKIQAVFGFCDIRQFTETTEVLREEVMLYVNEIANIVHTQVSAHAGQANRNMGDSFLLIWKKRPGEEESWTQICERALISFLKISVEVHRSTDLAMYQTSRHKTGAKLREAIPNFKVQLGFGLHVGWAIEGAIGSSRKIDASYLSPHVNLASRLEEVTRTYGVSMLLSGDFYNMLGTDAQRCSRKVDEVLMKGMSEPVSLYTYDTNYQDLELKLKAVKLKGDSDEEREDEIVDRRISLIGPSPIIDHSTNLVKVKKSAFRTDLELRAIQWEIPPPFIPLARKAVCVYLSGNWKQAKVLMDATIKISPSEKNGPCGFLLEYMQKHDFISPKDWAGYRILANVKKV